MHCYELYTGRLKIFLLSLVLGTHISANKIKSLNPDKKIFWSGYTNGWLGYLPTARAYEEGGHETRNTPLSPESEQLILDILKILFSLNPIFVNKSIFKFTHIYRYKFKGYLSIVHK